MTEIGLLERGVSWIVDANNLDIVSIGLIQLGIVQHIHLLFIAGHGIEVFALQLHDIEKPPIPKEKALVQIIIVGNRDKLCNES